MEIDYMHSLLRNALISKNIKQTDLERKLPELINIGQILKNMQNFSRLDISINYCAILEQEHIYNCYRPVSQPIFVNTEQISLIADSAVVDLILQLISNTILYWTDEMYMLYKVHLINGSVVLKKTKT